jgi:hypothetical protein
MAKISELDRITGSNTRSEDLFVVVNLAQGDDGTKAITRAELVNSIELEIFNNIKIDGGSYINNMPINNPNITVDAGFDSNTTIQGSDYFYLKDVSLGTTVAISYSQLYNEIAKTTKKAKKIYVSVDGDNDSPGSYLAPVATLERAFELAQSTVDTVEAGILERKSVNITVLPGTYYTNGELALPDFCSMTSESGQYATTIVMNEGFEKKNCVLLGSGCYVQGFSFFNLKVDNFDDPRSGFAFAFRPGARITRSPYIRDCSQISNYFEREIAPPLNPFNSKGGNEDLGHEVTVSSVTGVFEVGDTIEVANTGITGVVSRINEIGSGTIYIRNNSAELPANTSITSSSGGTASMDVIGEEDFPNKEVGRGGGMILADRAQVDQDSIFPYILAFGATPRTQNGIGYVARNGAGINGISSLSIFARCSFYALDGGQITLNNSGTQFGDISMRAKGTTNVFNPYQTGATIVANTAYAQSILDNANTIIDDMWDFLTITQGYSSNTVNEELTRRDANNFLISIANDFKVGKQVATRIFTSGLFNFNGEHVFSVFNANTAGLNYIDSVATVGDLPGANTVNVDDSYIVYSSNTNFYEGTIYYSDGSSWVNDGANDTTLLEAFTDSWDRMRDFIISNYSDGANTAAEETMLNGLIDDILIASVRAPRTLSFGSLVESLSHQFNLASAGVNVNALPLNFRRLGNPISAAASISQESGGRVRWSGADELNNQYFAQGLRINGRTGRLEGRPFTSSVRKLARRASNSRASI